MPSLAIVVTSLHADALASRQRPSTQRVQSLRSSAGKEPSGAFDTASLQLLHHSGHAIELLGRHDVAKDGLCVVSVGIQRKELVNHARCATADADVMDGELDGDVLCRHSLVTRMTLTLHSFTAGRPMT